MSAGYRAAACVSRIAVAPVGAVRFKQVKLYPKVKVNKAKIRPFYDTIPEGLTEDSPLSIHQGSGILRSHYPHWKSEFLPKAINIKQLPVQYYARAREVAKSLVPDEQRLLDAANETVMFDPDTVKMFVGIPERGAQTFYLYHRALMSSPDLPRYMVKDMMLNTAVPFRFLWTRTGRNMQATGRPNYLITSRHPLPPVVSREEAEGMSADHEFHDGAPISPFYGLSRDHYGSPRTNYGLNERSLLQYPHTMVFIQPKIKVNNAVTLLHLSTLQFGMLASFAVNRLGYRLGQDLPMPLTMQAIYTNGQYVVLTCFQLNTLDMDANSGLKNIFYSQQESAFYKVPWATADHRVKIPELNCDLYNQYFSFFTNYDWSRLDESNLAAASLF